MHVRITAILFAVLAGLLAGCSEQDQGVNPQEHKTEMPRESFEPRLLEALAKLGLDRTAIVLPKVPYPVSTRARLDLVTQSLGNPPSMAGISRRLAAASSRGTVAEIVSNQLQTLGIRVTAQTDSAPGHATMTDLSELFNHFNGTGQHYAGPPSGWDSDTAAMTAVRNLLYAIVATHRGWHNASGNLTGNELTSARSQINQVLNYTGNRPDPYRFLDDAFNKSALSINIDALASGLSGLLATVERSIHMLQQNASGLETGEWVTPLGRVKISGTGNDLHSGEFLLLIDPGGDDKYVNVTSPPMPGAVSVVIDLQGNDTIDWSEAPGPGTGLLGTGIWADMEGDDRYHGGNIGPGAGIMGAGMLWDADGDDIYITNTNGQGMGQYGIGLLLDGNGNDSYQAALNSQGYGGSGGVGILLDAGGEDAYSCGEYIPDTVEKRIKRHDTTRYLSLCQGFGFGVRPKISGGIGLLLDGGGNDHYKAGIFGQGAAYWFGLGLLVDSAGDDTYEAYEHCQGEGLHLAAGLLNDLGGNDRYTAYEHAQGVGKDRSAGILLDEAGNDSYLASKESQGAGLSSYGVGLLIEDSGDDTYRSLIDSQGYAGPDPEFPETEWPTGILLDFSGNNSFEMPYSKAVDSHGRIQNRQGIAIDYDNSSPGNPGQSAKAPEP